MKRAGIGNILKTNNLLKRYYLAIHSIISPQNNTYACYNTLGLKFGILSLLLHLAYVWQTDGSPIMPQGSENLGSSKQSSKLFSNFLTIPLTT